jgi:hypothetical protein
MNLTTQNTQLDHIKIYNYICKFIVETYDNTTLQDYLYNEYQVLQSNNDNVILDTLEFCKCYFNINVKNNKINNLIDALQTGLSNEYILQVFEILNQSIQIYKNKYNIFIIPDLPID